MYLGDGEVLPFFFSSRVNLIRYSKKKKNYHGRPTGFQCGSQDGRGRPFLANLVGDLSSINYTTAQLRRSLLPFYSILWGTRVLIALGWNRLLRMFARLRSTKLPKEGFIELDKLTRLNRNDSSILRPSPIDSWRPMIA